MKFHRRFAVSLRRNIVVSRFLATLLLGLAVLLATSASAADRFQPVSPEELTMTSEPLAPGAPAILLYRQVDRDDNGSTSHEDNYFRIKILTGEGRKYADIEIPFSKEEVEVVNVRARTIRPDGSIVNFDGKVFEKAILKVKGLRYLAKTFTLSDVQVGSIIEYYYTYDFREQYIFDSHWILSEELFTRCAKFSLKSYEPRYAKVTIRWTWQGLPPGTDPPKAHDQIIRLEAHNIPAFQTEDYMPPENELKSRVDFIYSYDPPEADKDKFWRQLGKKRNEQLESFINKRGDMQQTVSELVSPSEPPEAKLRKIYERVQQIRNTSYEVRKTQQEAKRETPKAVNNVADVWKRGYGNGVELTWLYLALARAAGFDAYGVWVSSRRNYFFNPTQMDSFRLNANVVLVKLNGNEIYCDPGAKFAPFGLLPWYETGVAGLQLDKEGGSWVKTPMPDSSVSRVERKADLKLTDQGDLQGKVTLTFTGLEAMQRRNEERNEDDAERKKYLEDHIKDYIPVTVEVELTNHPDWNNVATPLVAEFNLKVPGWISGAGRRALVPVGLFSETEKHLFEHEARVHPVYMEYPFQKIDDITIELPPGWKVGSLPPAKGNNGQVITYSLKVTSDNNRLHLVRTLDVKLLYLESKYYAALRNFFQDVRTGDEQQIVLQPGAATASK
jgi:hypothetical protein